MCEINRGAVAFAWNKVQALGFKGSLFISGPGRGTGPRSCYRPAPIHSRLCGQGRKREPLPMPEGAPSVQKRRAHARPPEKPGPNKRPAQIKRISGAAYIRTLRRLSFNRLQNCSRPAFLRPQVLARRGAGLFQRFSASASRLWPRWMPICPTPRITAAANSRGFRP